MPRRPSVREADAQADVECRAYFGSALDGFQHVPTHIADRLVGPPRIPDDLGRLRKEAIVLAKEIGKLQTGKAVDHRWASACLTLLGLEALGVEMWDFAAEDNESALQAVVDAAKAQVRHDSVAKTCRELDDQDCPF